MMFRIPLVVAAVGAAAAFVVMSLLVLSFCLLYCVSYVPLYGLVAAAFGASFVVVGVVWLLLVAGVCCCSLWFGV